MSEPSSLPSARFRAEREADWRRLDALLNRIERRSPAALNTTDLLDLPVLYGSTVSALSVARETSLDQSTIDYLEALATRAYLILYGARDRLGARMLSFFARDWPVMVAGLWRETLAMLALLAAGTLAGVLLVRADPAWYAQIVPADLAAGRTPDAGAATLAAALHQGGGGQDGLELLASFLFTHNAQLALACFALGFLLAVPTALFIVQNGLVLGALLQLYAAHGLAGELIGWLCIHGTTELFAIVLSGAAGLRIGWAVAFPGRLGRMEAMAAAGRTAGVVMIGVVVMLFAAALLEGFGRQLVQSEALRYAIGVSALCMWLSYFYLLSRISSRRG